MCSFGRLFNGFLQSNVADCKMFSFWVISIKQTWLTLAALYCHLEQLYKVIILTYVVSHILYSIFVVIAEQLSFRARTTIAVLF